MDRPGVVDREPDPRFEPVVAPEASSFSNPETWADGARGYEPVQPRWVLRDLLRKLAAPLIGLGFLILKFGGLLLKLKVVTTGASMFVSIAAYDWFWGLPFAIGFVLLIFVVRLLAPMVVRLKRTLHSLGSPPPASLPPRGRAV